MLQISGFLATRSILCTFPKRVLLFPKPCKVTKPFARFFSSMLNPCSSLPQRNFWELLIGLYRGICVQKEIVGFVFIPTYGDFSLRREKFATELNKHKSGNFSVWISLRRNSIGIGECNLFTSNDVLALSFWSVRLSMQRWLLRDKVFFSSILRVAFFYRTRVRRLHVKLVSVALNQESEQVDERSTCPTAACPSRGLARACCSPTGPPPP